MVYKFNWLTVRGAGVGAEQASWKEAMEPNKKREF
jgi:hypothetical protein